MNAAYTALITLSRTGEISMESGEPLLASSAQFSALSIAGASQYLKQTCKLCIKACEDCI